MLKKTNRQVWLDDVTECEQKLDNEHDYKYPGQHQKSPEKCTSPTTGPGWAQRVKGWFSSVCVPMMSLFIFKSTHHTTACLPCCFSTQNKYLKKKYK